jgi:hypothetical protein
LQIRDQVEFYFSTSNYKRDSFMKAAAESDPEGYIPITTMITFNKLKVLSMDIATISEAMGESENVTVSDCGTKLKRSFELENVDSLPRILYVKGYPTDDPDVNIDSIKVMFSEFGKCSMITMRKETTNPKAVKEALAKGLEEKKEKKFKGSAFIEYDSEEAVAKAVAACNTDGKCSKKFKDKEFLCIIPFTEWHTNKKKKAKVQKDKKKTKEEKGKGGESSKVSHTSIDASLLLTVLPYFHLFPASR